jgi:hypothetical protein
MAALRPCVLHRSRPATSSGRLVYVLEENTIFLFSCIIFYFSFFFLLNNKQQYPTAKFLFRLAMSDDDDDLCRFAPLEN